MTTFEKFQGIIVTHLGIAAERVTPYAALIDDLGMDSLDTIEIAITAETEFGVNLADDKIEKLATVDDAVRLIDAELAAAKARSA